LVEEREKGVFRGFYALDGGEKKPRRLSERKNDTEKIMGIWKSEPSQGVGPYSKKLERNGPQPQMPDEYASG